MKRFFAILVTFLLFIVAIYGQSPTSAGKDFWLSFGDNAGQSHTNISLQIYIAAIKKTEVCITYTATGKKEIFSVYPNTITPYPLLLSEEREAAYSNVTGKTKKSIRIETNEDVSVYAINIGSASADATMILPSNVLSNSYYHLSYRPTSRDGYTIVAIENNTIIYENGTIKETLNQGEVYSSYFPGDNSGKQITANHPFACFTTNSCANVPSNVDDCDCLYEQQYPQLWWGRHFFVPVTIRGAERIRIMASQDNTIINTDGTIISGSMTLNAGQWAEIEIDAAQNGCYIKTTHPVAVASYPAGKDYTKLNYSPGAPSMAWIPPIEQFVSETAATPFDIENSSVFNEHHLLIVVPEQAKNLTEIKQGDGVYTAPTGGSWHDHSSGYSYYTLPLKKHTSIKNPEGLFVFAYGLGDVLSYYYQTGLTPLEDSYFEVNNINYKEFQDTILCDGNIKVDARINYEMKNTSGHLRWLLNDVEQTAFTDTLHWTTHLSPGNYTISMIAKYKHEGPDTLSTSFTVARKPEKTIINDTICQYDSYVSHGFVLEDIQKSGTIIDTTLTHPTASGCDSIVYLNLYANPAKNTLIKDTACLNMPYDKYGFKLDTLKTLGIHNPYPLRLTTTHGCDSVVRLELYVDAPGVTTINDTICLNEPYNKNEFNIDTLKTPGAFEYSIIRGCDNTKNLHLFVKEPANSTTVASICEGESFHFHGTNYTIPGTYLHHPTECNGTDTLILAVNPTYYTERVENIFSGDVFLFNEHSYDKGGVYTEALQTINGCDSVFVIHIHEIILPNTFTPNGDGINDIFLPEYHIQVYTRNGLLMYDGTEGWDGNHKGEPVAKGTYFYILYYQTDYGTKSKNGYVVLAR